MTNVLVTGGAGYIGSHACKVLKSKGFTPVTYDNLCTGWQDAVKFGPFEQGDLRDGARLDEVFAKHKPAAIMHFAALTQVAWGLPRALETGEVLWGFALFLAHLVPVTTAWLGSGRAMPAAARAASMPLRCPKTRPSSRELEPRRLAPWTLVQAASPAARRPGTLVRPWESVEIPPME